jgi:catalase
VHNNQQDGYMRYENMRGRINYEPNSLGGGCPMQSPENLCAFVSHAERIDGHKVRERSESFNDHFTQATLFWNSQSDVEKSHIIRAFRFELTKVQTAAVRERVIAQLRNVADELASAVAAGIGLATLPDPLPRLLKKPAPPEVTESPALSLLARPGAAGIKTRRVALLVADGVDGAALRAIHQALAAEGAVARFVGATLGSVESVAGDPIEVEISLETGPSVLWDAVVLPAGEAAVEALLDSGHALEFLKDQYRHCKPILVLGTSTELLEEIRIPAELPDGGEDPGLLVFDGSDPAAAAAALVAALTQHRHFDRETDPPLI